MNCNSAEPSLILCNTRVDAFLLLCYNVGCFCEYERSFVVSTNSVQKKKFETYEPASLLFTKWFLWLYSIAFFVIYPFYFENKYFNMGEAKWNFYKAITFGTKWGNLPVPGLLMCTGVCAIWYLITLLGRGEFEFRGLWKKLSIIDKFVLIYLVFAILSCIAAPDKENVIWGYSGWYMGLAAQISFVILYFLMSRFSSISTVMKVCAFAATGVVALIAVLNRFGLDPLGMYEGVDIRSGEAHAFLTTMGNSTWYGCLLGIMLAMGIGLFWYSEKTWVRILSAIFCFICFMSAVTSDSDAIFAGIFAMYSALWFFSFSEARKFVNFWEAIALCLLAFRFTGILQKAFPDASITTGSISLFMSQNAMLWIPTIAAALLSILLYRSNLKGKVHIEKITWLKHLYFIVLGAGLFLFILFLVLNSTGKLPSFVKGSDNNYLLFNDYWGNNRGGIWRVSLGTFFKSFADHPLNALFGWGPDSMVTGIYTYYSEDLANIVSAASMGSAAVLTNAHNEWLNLLLCTGLTGGVAYLGIFLSAVRRFTHHVKEYSEVSTIVIAVITYLAFDFFCYQQIISTPLIFILIGLGEFYITGRDVEE